MTGQCDEKEPAVKHYGWIVKHTKTGKTLRHLKVDGDRVEYAGMKWCSLSAFAWVGANDWVMPHFNEQAAHDMANLYKAQTGDMAVTVEKVEIL